MAVSVRRVENKRDASGQLTGREGKVYDVNIKYRLHGKWKSYTKKGFRTKKEALEHEAAMRAKLVNSTYTPPTSAQCKLTVEEYLLDWIEMHGKTNLRPNTEVGYRNNIRRHINPNIGNVPLRQVTGEMLDKLYAKLAEEGLSQSSLRYVHRILGVAFEHARKYHYIDNNPARDIITRFGKQGKTPDPYTVEQMRFLLEHTEDNQFAMILVLGGLYGLRASEILGLRWRNVDLEGRTFAVVEQLPSFLPKGTVRVEEMAPVKSCERTLPITEATLLYFRRQADLQAEQKMRDSTYIDNDLVIAKPNGVPEHRERVSRAFRRHLERLDLPRIRFHDLRHSAATNMHQLTGDFFTVGEILGHSLKGIGNQLNISANLGTVTAQYVNVRLDRKKLVLETYHNAIFDTEPK